MSSDYLSARGKALEDSFFAKKNVELLEAMKSDLAETETKNAISKISGITDEATLSLIASLDFTAETFTAFSLIPLIEVAWADNKMEKQERTAILEAATENGIAQDSAAQKLLENWLDESTAPELKDAWISYANALASSMPTEAKQIVHEKIVNRARKVAQAAGGILGLGQKISSAEQAVLDQLSAAFE